LRRNRCVITRLRDGVFADKAECARRVRMLGNQLTFEPVPLLACHLRHVQRIIKSSHVLDRFFGAAMNPGDPGVCGPVRTVRVIRPDPGQISIDNFVGVLLELARQLGTEPALSSRRGCHPAGRSTSRLGSARTIGIGIVSCGCPPGGAVRQSRAHSDSRAPA
jgi:hypothetical protein